MEKSKEFVILAFLYRTRILLNFERANVPNLVGQLPTEGSVQNRQKVTRHRREEYRFVVENEIRFGDD